MSFWLNCEKFLFIVDNFNFYLDNIFNSDIIRFMDILDFVDLV